MVAPQRVTVNQYNELVDRWLEENSISIGIHHTPECSQLGMPLEVVSVSCTCGGREMHVCKICGRDISYRYAIMSVHHGVLGGCVSSGEILHPTLPYCSDCNALDRYYGCVHIEQPAAITSQEVEQDWKVFNKEYCIGAAVVLAIALVVWCLSTYF